LKLAVGLNHSSFAASSTPVIRTFSSGVTPSPSEMGSTASGNAAA
jgi:hypothetical protein